MYSTIHTKQRATPRIEGCRPVKHPHQGHFATVLAVVTSMLQLDGQLPGTMVLTGTVVEMKQYRTYTLETQ